MKFILLSVLGCVSFVAAQNFGECQTPNYASGQCIYAKNCESIRQILAKKPLTFQDRIFLGRSQCGYRDGQPLVCCASVASNIAPRPPIRPQPQPAPASGANVLPTPGSGKCGVGYEDRIYGGVETEVNEFPWLVLLEYQKSGRRSFGCGGILINERYILTAAHCLEAALPAGYSLINVRLGEWDTTTAKDCDDTFVNEVVCNNPPQDISIAEKIPHEAYNPQDRHNYNDIALLRLSRAVVFDEFIKPICLPSTQQLRTTSLVGQKLIVAGWGRTETKQKSERKLKVEIEGSDFNSCARTYKTINVNLKPTQMCAGGVKGQDSCQGDSGGPLMARTSTYWYLTGLVSFGPRDCGQEGWPGVYTNVAQYVDWINSKVKP